jgi:hypothetical protein
VKEDKLEFTIKYGKIDNDGMLVGEGFKVINCSIYVNKESELILVHNCYQGGVITHQISTEKLHKVSTFESLIDDLILRQGVQQSYLHFLKDTFEFHSLCKPEGFDSFECSLAN